MVPSGSFKTLETSQHLRTAFWESELRSSWLKFVIASKLSTPFPIHSKICFPRKAGVVFNCSEISSGKRPETAIFSFILPRKIMLFSTNLKAFLQLFCLTSPKLQCVLFLFFEKSLKPQQPYFCHLFLNNSRQGLCKVGNFLDRF